MSYEIGYQLYQEGRYKDSAAVFTRLVLQSPFEESYWRGLASTRQMQRKFEEALHAWSLVALLVEEDPSPHFHAAECLFALRDGEQALKAVALAEERLEESDPLIEHIRTMKEHYALPH